MLKWNNNYKLITFTIMNSHLKPYLKMILFYLKIFEKLIVITFQLR